MGAARLEPARRTARRRHRQPAGVGGPGARRSENPDRSAARRVNTAAAARRVEQIAPVLSASVRPLVAGHDRGHGARAHAGACCGGRPAVTTSWTPYGVTVLRTARKPGRDAAPDGRPPAVLRRQPRCPRRGPGPWAAAGRGCADSVGAVSGRVARRRHAAAGPAASPWSGAAPGQAVAEGDGAATCCCAPMRASTTSATPATAVTRVMAAGLARAGEGSCATAAPATVRPRDTPGGHDSS